MLSEMSKENAISAGLTLNHVELDLRVMRGRKEEAQKNDSRDFFLYFLRKIS